MKMYVTADEAAQILGVSGKVPTKYFKEKFYGMAVG